MSLAGGRVVVLKVVRLLLLFVATLVGNPGFVSGAPTHYVYVLTNDGNYVVVDVDAGRIVTTGNIPEVQRIDRAYEDQFGGRVYLQVSSLAGASSNQPTTRLAIISKVNNANNPALRFSGWLRPPTPSSSVTRALAISNSVLLVSWQDERSSTVKYESTSNRSQRVIENFLVTPTTCVSTDGQTVYSVANNPSHEIKALNLTSGEVRNSSYALLGSATAFYKAPVATDGCTMAFIERMAKSAQGSSPATVYVYDVERGTTLIGFGIAGDGRFALSLKQSLLLLDLSALVPNKLPDGTTAGLRRVNTGSLIFYDTAAGRETGRIAVPQKGELAGISADETTAYYLSPNLLIVIDLLGKRVAVKIDLPFSNGMLPALIR